MSLPKPVWPTAPERGSREALRAEYEETRKRADQAIEDLKAGRPQIERARIGVIYAIIALVICVTLLLAIAIHALSTRYQHLPGAAFDRWTGRVVHPGEPATAAQP